MTNPSGVAVDYLYGSEAADKLGRVDKIKLDGTERVSYAYLGMATPVKVTYAMPDSAPDIEMSYASPSGINPGGDQYSGLDQFGRVIGVKWSTSSADLVDATYGYDRASNRKWRRDEQAHALSNGEEDMHDKLYGYDGFYQLVESRRGDLTGPAGAYTGITNVQEDEDWCYDALGNWQQYIYDEAGGTPNDFTQNRGHNKANEITSISAPGTISNPTYDAVGNMTKGPQPASWNSNFDLKWDAWNRLVEVDAGGSNPVQTNRYDGLARRITEEDEGGKVRHFYYNDQWRSVEEYIDSATSPERRHLWGARNRWDLILRQQDVAGNIVTLNVLYDAIDPVAIADDSSAVVERFEYTPFGDTAFMNLNFVGGSSSNDWNFLFHGEFLDGATGYYNYGYRYYDPKLGRWLSRDPIGERGGITLYGFVGNNAVNWVDSYGLTASHDASNQAEHEGRNAFKSALKGALGAAKAAADAAVGALGKGLQAQGPIECKYGDGSYSWSVGPVQVWDDKDAGGFKSPLGKVKITYWFQGAIPQELASVNYQATASFTADLTVGLTYTCCCDKETGEWAGHLRGIDYDLEVTGTGELALTNLTALGIRIPFSDKKIGLSKSESLDGWVLFDTPCDE